MEQLPIILLIAFVLGSIISFWIWYSIEKTTDEDAKDDLDDIEDNNMYTEANDDFEFIKYWYS